MSHSLTSNTIKQKQFNDTIERMEDYPEETKERKLQEEKIMIVGERRNSVDYERTGLADQIVSLPLEIQKGKYQSPQTRQCIIDDDIKWQEFEYQKKVSFDYYSKQTPFNYNDFYDDIISIVQIVFGKDKHNGLIKKTIVEKTILELLQ